MMKPGGIWYLSKPWLYHLSEPLVWELPERSSFVSRGKLGGVGNGCYKDQEASKNTFEERVFF